MENAIKISRNILDEINKVATEGAPVLESKMGSLFLLETAPVGMIKLKVSPDEYLAYLRSLDSSERPDARSIVPVNNLHWRFVVLGNIKFEDGSIFMDDRKVVIL